METYAALVAGDSVRAELQPSERENGAVDVDRGHGPSLVSSGRYSMADLKPNSDRRVEGEETAGAHQEGRNSVQAGQRNDVRNLPLRKSPATGRSNKPSKNQQS